MLDGQWAVGTERGGEWREEGEGKGVGRGGDCVYNKCLRRVESEREETQSRERACIAETPTVSEHDMAWPGLACVLG